MGPAWFGYHLDCSQEHRRTFLTNTSNVIVGQLKYRTIGVSMLLLELISGELSWNEHRLGRLARSEVSVLAFFMENSGILLSQDKLLDAGWPDTIVAPNSLVGAIKNIRKSLSIIDSGVFIETVHRRGYIFHSGSELCKVIEVAAKTSATQMGSNDIDEQCDNKDKDKDKDKSNIFLEIGKPGNGRAAKKSVIIDRPIHIAKKTKEILFYMIFIIMVLTSIYIEKSKSNLNCYQINHARVCGVFNLKQSEINEISKNIGMARGEFIYGHEKDLSDIKLYKVK